MTDICDPIRVELRDLEQQLTLLDKFLKDPPHPVINPEWKKVDGQIRSKRAGLTACEESLLPSTPVPVTLSLTTFVCIDQSDEIRIVFGFNTEDDEPYAVAFAVDLQLTTPASIPVGAANLKATLVGPLADVDPGERAAPPNIIWGLSGAPALVSSADGLIILVAMMENDGSSPDQVRTVLEGAARVSLLSNLSALVSGQIARQELVNRIIAGMAGAMGLAKVGAPDPDDNIGPIQELRFTQNDLDHIYRSLGPIEKSLTFEGDDAKYALRFSMFR